MTSLLISFLALLAAPLLCRICTTRPALGQLMDGFIFIAIGGLILTSVLPQAVQHGGWAAVAFLLMGLLLPVLTERVLHKVGDVHRIAVLLGLSGLFLHAITDGAALASGANGHGDMLGVAVLLHRLPIGLTLWWLTYPQFGPWIASAVLGIIALGTGFGYGFAPDILQPLSSEGVAYFQAFVTGTLVHVLYHRPHAPEEHCGHTEQRNWPEGFGNLLGALLVVYLMSLHGGLGDSQWLNQASDALLHLALASAPALLLAYVLAGLVLAFMPQSYVDWMQRGKSWQQAMRGVAVGLPLPVCSCGVVPLYHTLIRKGAPPAAAMAFLIATPELGIDAVLLSLPLLGTDMTIARVVAAALVALIVGIVVSRVAKDVAHQQVDECCTAETATLPWQQKLASGLRQGLGELVDHTGPWIIAGLLLAAVAEPLLSQGVLDVIPGPLEIPFFALVGMPVYICAAGATPLVAVFLFSGVSPGAALAFLITGPATNVTTLGVLSSLHGRKTALIFTAVTLSITIVLAYLTNAIMGDFSPVALAAEDHGASSLQKVSLACLLALYLYSILRRGARAFLMELFSPSTMGNESGHSHAHA